MRISGPEKTITESSILWWAKRNGFDLTVVDTAAVYSRAAKRYLKSQSSESLPDLVGNCQYLSVWIELKAPKKRRTILQSPHQVEFLIRKINQGCFACVTDSVEHIDNLWRQYCSAENEDQRKQILLNDIPKKE